MPRTDRLGITVSLVLLGLTLSMLVQLPSRQFAFEVLGSELAVEFTGPVQLAVLMAALVCAGVDAIIRSHPQLRVRSLAYTATFWVLPSLLTLAGLYLVNALPWWGYQIILVGLTGLMLSLVIVAQYRSLDTTDPRYREMRLVLNVVTYAAALILFLALYGPRLRSVISATGVVLASSMLTLELLRSTEAKTWRTWFYAFLVGMMMGELMWVLNYYSLDTRLGGALLLIFFYTLTGLMQQYLWGRLNRRVVAEFAVLCAFGLCVVAGFVQWLQR